MQIRIIEWKEQVTQSGIQLSGLTQAIKYGELLSTNAFPVMDQAGRQGVVTILTVRKLDDNKIISMPAEMCVFTGYADAKVSYQLDNEQSIVETLKKSE